MSFFKSRFRIPPKVTANIVNTDPVELYAAGGEGFFNVITDLLVTNGGAGDTWVKIVEQDTNIVLWRGFAAANGNGFNQPAIKTPLRQPTANKKLNVVCESAGAAVCVSASGYKED